MTLRDKLEELYAARNRREWVRPDPLQFLYEFPKVEDREIAALLAASLAYGRVGHILRSLELLLGRIGPHPAAVLDGASARERRRLADGFVHRWTRSADIVRLFEGIKRQRALFGSLNASFLAGYREDHATIFPALADWTSRLSGGALISDPARGSACKRLHLFLRWMIRRDDVDPGGWTGISPAKLIVPLDVHMHRMARAMRLTKRRAADQKTALEITARFRAIAPDDPVKFDFVLTRFGIRDGLTDREVRAEIKGWGIAPNVRLETRSRDPNP